MSKTATINVRVSPDIKQQAEELFSKLGISLSAAISLFLSTSIREQGIPFELYTRVPNAETIAAIEECDKIIRGEIEAKRYTDVDELIADLMAVE